MKDYYTVNDVIGYSGINAHRQKKLCDSANINRGKRRVNGQLIIVYTKDQFRRLLVEDGWYVTDDYAAKRYINLGEE